VSIVWGMWAQMKKRTDNDPAAQNSGDTLLYLGERQT